MISSSKDLEEFGRYNIDIPIRQGFLYRKTLKSQGRNLLRPSWRINWTIVSTQGIFFFDPNRVEATEAKAYVLTTEPRLKFTDESKNDEKKYQIVIESDVSHMLVVFQSWDEKDLWMRGFKQAMEQARETILKKNGNNKNSNRSGDVSHQQLVSNTSTDDSSLSNNPDAPHSTIGKLVPDDARVAAPTVFQMKARVVVKIREAKDLEKSDTAIMGGLADPYVVLNMEHKVEHTRVENNTLEPKWREEFTFDISRLPCDLHVIIFDKDRFQSDDILGQVVVKVESARAGADKEDWFPLRPVCVGEKASGKIHMRVECRYDLSTQGKVTFGVPLVDLHARHPERVLPDICYKCISRLYKRNLTTEGLFRVPGNKNRMRAYEIQFDQNPDQDIKFSEGEDEHTIAGLLKLFLRELPEPPIPHALYSSVLQLDKISDKNEKIDHLREIMHKLPEHNYFLLQCMCCLLHRITTFSHINMMKETNLAIVFGPVFAYPPSSLNVSKQQFLAQHLPALSSVCELMISHFVDIFHNDRVLDCLVYCENNWTQFKKLIKDPSNVPLFAEGSRPLSTDQITVDVRD
ncbi:hypothetical protein FDP41_002177 [Naegleria fowleri]|uniref:Rho-GAP domain-containing protein n=1 Tax=Naegleria fowleri TaxID=5763 RepID=A0A6A5BPT0_NAEFO|nr:uncharacterized protein FDP41_002177 [Naegleria fowleri]KAF0979107.1 hypothetical protein FDP41_002177 [Naegleria fowleri]CAG4718076.1 unnamed protein product [Naegleria fowleri]